MPNSSLKSQNAEQSQNQRDKTVDTRELRGKTSEPELLFSFKFFDTSQIPPAQHFREWELDTPANNCLKEILKIKDGYLQKIKIEDSELHEIIFEEFMEGLDKILKKYSMTDSAKQGLLSDFFEKLVDLSRLTKNEAKNGAGGRRTKTSLGIYPDFDFKKQSEFKESWKLPDAQWAAIKRVGGREARVAGFIIENVFYVVFLDKNHQFYVGDGE